MTQYTKVELTAPCGLDCFNCPLLEDNITEQLRQIVAKRLELAPEQVRCEGCRVQGGKCLFASSCATLECIRKKKVDYCFRCDEFPCLKLAPAKEGADTFPHNFKLYNLCRMKAVGVEKWAEEESARIRKLYYEGHFIPGTGPVEKKADR